jgi:predicted amidophosphoribosyltransferase
MSRAGAELLNEADLLVPIPLHWTRLARRRFNQSAALAKAIEALSAVPMETELLYRVNPTPPQVGLTRRLRVKNIQGAFEIEPARRIRSKGAESCWWMT